VPILTHYRLECIERHKEFDKIILLNVFLIVLVCLNMNSYCLKAKLLMPIVLAAFLMELSPLFIFKSASLIKASLTTRLFSFFGLYLRTILFSN